MKKLDPDFDVFSLEDDAKEIITECYESFLKNDMEYVEKVAGGDALTFFKALRASWEHMEVKPKLEHIWHFEELSLSCKFFFDSRG